MRQTICIFRGHRWWYHLSGETKTNSKIPIRRFSSSSSPQFSLMPRHILRRNYWYNQITTYVRDLYNHGLLIIINIPMWRPRCSTMHHLMTLCQEIDLQGHFRFVILLFHSCLLLTQMRLYLTLSPFFWREENIVDYVVFIRWLYTDKILSLSGKYPYLMRKKVAFTKWKILPTKTLSVNGPHDV